MLFKEYKFMFVGILYVAGSCDVGAGAGVQKWALVHTARGFDWLVLPHPATGGLALGCIRYGMHTHSDKNNKRHQETQNNANIHTGRKQRSPMTNTQTSHCFLSLPLHEILLSDSTLCLEKYSRRKWNTSSKYEHTFACIDQLFFVQVYPSPLC